MNKRFLSMAMATCMTAGLVGCSSSGGSDATGKVYWLNFKPEMDEALQNIAKSYKDQTG